MPDEGDGAGHAAGVPRVDHARDGSRSDGRSGGGETGRSAGDRAPPARCGLGEHAQHRLMAQLRVMYDTVAQQPVPERFAELIARLDARTDKDT